MDIPAVSMSMASAKLTQGVSISMMKKAMDQVEQTGEQLIQMMDAADVSGSKIDIKL